MSLPNVPVPPHDYYCTMHITKNYGMEEFEISSVDDFWDQLASFCIFVGACSISTEENKYRIVKQEAQRISRNLTRNRTQIY